MYSEIIGQYPKCMPAHMALVSKLDTATDMKTQLPFAFKSSLDTEKDGAKTMDKLKRIVDLCDAVIAGIDASALLQFFGIKSDNRVDASKIKS